MKKIINTGLLVIIGLFMYIFSYGETVSISGKITQFTTSSLSLNDIVIEVKGTQNLKVKTNRTGTYIIAGLQKGGNYTLSVSKPGYTFSPETKTFKNLEESQINQNFVASMATYSISGKVMVGGKPVRNVVVMINNRPIKYYTDQDGAYVIDNLEYNGPYEVKVISDKHHFKPFQIDYLKEDVIHDFQKDITISGRVTSLGEGVENIGININGSIYKTDADGYYKIDSLLANGDYTISVVEEKYNPSPSSIPLRKITGDKENLDFTISGEIIGKVTYSNGQPFRNAIVKINDRNTEYKTNAQGMYKITDVGLNQEYTVTVSSSGFSFTPKQATVKSIIKQNTSLNFKAGVIKYDVTVYAQQGEEPLENVSIVVNNDLSYKTDKSGKCIISLAQNKKYTLKAVKSGNVFVEATQTIDNLLQDETVTFKSFLDVSGKVEIDGKGLFNSVVTCNDKTVKTNKSGIYTFKNLKPDTNYVIKVSSGNYSFEPEQIVIDNLTTSYKDKNFVVKTDNEQSILASKQDNKKTGKQKKDIVVEADIVNTPSDSVKDERARLKAEREEAERLAKEEELRAKLELEAEQKRLKEEAAEQKRLEKEAKIQAAKDAEAERARLKAEREEAERLAKEEELRAKLELEAEQKRLKEEAAEQKRLEKEAKIQAAKDAEAERARLKAEREEAERLAKEEELRAKLELEAEQKRLKEEAAEQKRLEKEAKIQAAKQAKLEAEAEKARIKAEKEEAIRLAKEEAAQKKLEAAERKRLEKEAETDFGLKVEKQPKESLKAEKQEIKTEQKQELSELDEDNLYLEDDMLSKPLTAAEKKKLMKDYEEKQKREEAEQKRLEKEAKKLEAEAEKARIKAEKEEADRLAKEEQQRLKQEAEAEKARIKAEKEEADRLAKEEQQRLKQEAEAEKARIKAEKEEADRLAKEEQQRSKQEAQQEKERLKMRKQEIADIDSDDDVHDSDYIETKIKVGKTSGKKKERELVSIEGRVLKSKDGVKGVQVRLLLPDEERIYLTDKNGYYKIPDLEKNKNYLVTVLSGKETLNMSPKSKTYKNLKTNMKNQNFYVVEKIKVAEKEDKENKNNSWNSEYGFENKGGIIKKDIHW